MIPTPGSTQSRVRLCAQAVPRSDPRYTALQIANTVFSGYFASRMIQNLREDKGYVYTVESGFQSSPGHSTLLLALDVATHNTAPAVLESHYEMGRMALAGPTTEEIAAARRYTSGSLLTWMESQSLLATSLFNLAGLGLDPEWLYTHQRRLRAVPDEDVHAAARDFLAPSAFTGIILGDTAEIAPPLHALGGVTGPDQ